MRFSVLLIISFLNVIILFQGFAEESNYINKNEKLHLNMFTKKIFNKEFVNTSSLEDFSRSFKRLNSVQILKIDKLKLNRIYEELNQEKKSKFDFLIKKVSEEAIKKTQNEINYFYKYLKIIIREIVEINDLAHFEIKLVEQLKLKSKDHLDYKNYNNNYFFYLINHLRYEIFISYLIKNQNL